MNKKANILTAIFLVASTLFLLVMYVTDYMNGVGIGLTGVMVIVLLVMSWLQFLTWGSDTKVQKDELGEKIAMISARLSYFILTGSLFLLWIVDRIVFIRRNEFGNETLFAALCLAIVLFPVTQFFTARKYR